MSGISDYASGKMYDAITGKGAWTATNLYAVLSTADGTDDNGAGIAAFTTTTNGTSGRLVMANANWGAAANASSTYSALMDWGAATGASSGDIIAIAFYDANTAGNFMGWTTMAVDKAIADTDLVEIPSGNIDIDIASGKNPGVHLLNADMNKALDAFTGKTTFALASNRLFVGLLSAAPALDDAATNGTEITGNFPADRLNAVSASWTADTDGTGNYNAILDWGTATGTSTIVGYGLYLSVTGGTADMVGYQALTSSVTVDSGDDFEIAAGEIILNCNVTVT